MIEDSMLKIMLIIEFSILTYLIKSFSFIITQNDVHIFIIFQAHVPFFPLPFYSSQLYLATFFKDDKTSHRIYSHMLKEFYFDNF